MEEKFLMNYDITTGEIKGFYLKSIHGDNVPTPTIEITPEKHTFYMEHNGQYKVNTTTLEDELMPVETSIPVLTLDERIAMLENLQLLEGGVV